MPTKPLTVGMVGENVAALHQALAALGLSIPEAEMKRRFFGPGTREAVKQCQAQSGLTPSGICDEGTGALLHLPSGGEPPPMQLRPRTSELPPLTRAVPMQPIESPGRTPVTASRETAPGDAGAVTAHRFPTRPLSDPARPPDRFIVQGRVLYESSGAPVKGIVRAFDRGLRSEKLLGEARADGAGHYEISYRPEQLLGVEKKSVAVVIRAFNPDGSLLGSSLPLFNVQPVETVDLVISGKYQGSSEYEQLAQELSSLLQGLAFGELTEDDITFLSGQMGADPRRIACLREAHRFSVKTKLPAEVFYGLLCQNLPADLSALVAYSPEALRFALENTFKENIIPARSQDDVESVLHRLQAMDVEQPVFLFKPEVLFGRVGDLDNLAPEQAGFVTTRLNERFRREVLSRIGTVDEPMASLARAAVARLDFRELKDANLSAVIRQSVLAEAKKDKNLANEAARVEARLAQLPSAKVGNVLGLGTPVKDNPAFAADLRRIKTLEYARLARLDSQTAKKLVARNLVLQEANDATLANLVKEGLLNEQQKAELRETVEFAKLTDDNLAFISAIKARNVKSVPGLIDWDKTHWQQIITDEKLPVPPDETAESYAETIMFNIERTFPSQSLFTRLLTSKQATRLNLLDSLNGLLDHNERLIDGKKPASLDWKGVKPDQREQSEQALQEVTAFANTYRHLGVADLINDKTKDLAEKKKDPRHPSCTDRHFLHQQSQCGSTPGGLLRGQGESPQLEQYSRGGPPAGQEATHGLPAGTAPGR